MHTVDQHFPIPLRCTDSVWQELPPAHDVVKHHLDGCCLSGDLYYGCYCFCLQVYSLVHKLGCVARGAASQGLLPTDAAGQPISVEEGVATGASSSSSKQAEFSRCMQMVQLLKQEAEKLLLTAAREPVTT